MLTMAQKCLIEVNNHIDKVGGLEYANEWKVIDYPSSDWSLDEEATQEADPTDTGNVAIFDDGSKIVWNDETCIWGLG